METINKTSGELIDNIERNYKEICKERGIDLAAASQQSAAQFPGAKEQALDEYPVPDPALSEEDLAKCSCLDSDLLPLSKERANELMERDLTVYIIQDGEKPEMAFDVAELDAHDGIFALSRDEWEKTSEFHGRVQDRMNHQEERERAFLDFGGDCFAIYQLKQTDDLRDIRYEGLERLKASGQEVQHSNYDLVYTAPLTSPGSTSEQLGRLYEQFNLQKPADFHSSSMSVSDIVAIRQGGRLSCYYCDRIGFEQIPGFLPSNPLKNAEMSVEDDYGMIDGIINNGPKEPQDKDPQEQEKKKSVREQLQAKPRTKHKKTAPKRSAEREM